MAKIKPWTAKQTRIAMLRFAEHYRPLAEEADHYILGIDPSMSGTAIAINGGHSELFDWKSISTSKQVSQAAKLVKIREEVRSFSSSYAGKYLMVVCEDVNVMSHITGVVAVASAKAVSLEAVASAFTATDREAPYFFPVVNRTIKKALSGNGKAEKQEQVTSAEKLIGESLDGDDDSADAIGATLCGVFFLRLVREILNTDLTQMSIDEQANWVRLLMKSLKSECPAHEVEVAEGMLKSKKIFKENFGKYAYDKIRKEIKEIV